ncbi:MAG: recombinase family protein [Christensenellaceae bacterium]|nr:recombinase family protein [Christensenellaceae bacterium]MEA5068296.1 recombinase family protein [Christensenellaceae bacterium]
MARIIRKLNPVLPMPPRLLNVAAYARVSLDKDSMLHSLSAQVSHYSDRIQKHPGWRYAGVYADKALTGTKAERPEFQRLLADCRAGKIDMVITKSISRFARNTVTLLETVRELKALGVDIYFEEQNIHSMSAAGELMLTILASYAQEESRSVSENCTWRVRKKFEAGIPTTTQILGYKIHRGTFTIIPEEAEIVRMIFADYLGGMGRNAIYRKVIVLDIPTKTGRNWSEANIDEILRNEKYVGDLLLQKFFREDHLAKKDRRNRGELPRFYLRDHHEAIIARADFDRVQDMLKERCEYFHPYEYRPTDYPFRGMLVCGNCGKAYNRKTTLGKVSWQCATYLRLGKAHCHAKQIPEDTLMEVTASVLGLPEFDEAIFKRRIREIRVPAFNHLVFVFEDGTEETRVWQDKSRRDSWDFSMRLQAAEHARRRYEQ